MDNELINIIPARNTHNLNLLLLLIPIISFILILALLSTNLNKGEVAGMSDSKDVSRAEQNIK